MHRNGRENGMRTWFIYEVWTRRSRRNRCGRDQGTRKQTDHWQIYKSQKDKYKFITFQSVKGSFRTTNLTLHHVRGIQNASNHHHLQVCHQAQHGGVRLLRTKVGRNGTRTGGKTTNGQTNGKERQSRIHAQNSRWKQFGVSEKFNVFKSNLWVLIPCSVLQQLFFFRDEHICTNFSVMIVFFWQFRVQAVATAMNVTRGVGTTLTCTRAYAHFSRAHFTRDHCSCGSRLISVALFL